MNHVTKASISVSSDTTGRGSENIASENVEGWIPKGDDTIPYISLLFPRKVSMNAITVEFIK